jgi:hypothetical protein
MSDGWRGSSTLEGLRRDVEDHAVTRLYRMGAVSPYVIATVNEAYSCTVRKCRGPLRVSVHTCRLH